jgi:hypothetical protein
MNDYLEGNVQVINVLRAQVEIIEGKELPMARSKADVCRASGWSWLESYFTSYANRLEYEMQQMKIIIDRQLDANAAR